MSANLELSLSASSLCIAKAFAAINGEPATL